MAHNGYHQQYQQPPPQGQHQYDSRNNARAWAMQGNAQPQTVPQQIPPQPNNYAKPSNGYQNGHGEHAAQQYDQQGHWHEPQFQDPYQQNQQYPGQYQDPYASSPQPSRTYQYDERYRNHGQASPQPMNGQMHHNGHKPRDKHRPQALDGHTRPKPRERILAEPQSPKSLAWDNPFGTFPPKKKDAHKHLRHASLDAAKGGMLGAYPAVNANQRPNTSQSHRNPGPSRPSTSHGQRPTPLPESPRLPPDVNMPLKKPPLGPERKQFPMNPPGQVGLPARPAPIRSVTQPSPGDPQFQQYGSVDPYSFHQQKGNDSSYFQQPTSQMYHQRPSDQTYDRKPRQQSFDQHAYRGVPLHKPTSNPSYGNPDMPNFDVGTPPLNETTFEAAPAQQEQSAYAKKPYQALAQIDTKRAHPPPMEDSAKSPLAAFSFDLPQANSAPRNGPQNPQQPSNAFPTQHNTAPVSTASMGYNNAPPAAAPVHYVNSPQSAGPTQYDNPPLSPGPVSNFNHQPNYDSRPQHQPPRTTSRQQGPQPQYPPRGASRADKDASYDRAGGPNDSGYWQASPEHAAARPFTAGNNQPRGPQTYRKGSNDNAQAYRTGSREDYAQGYDQGYGPNLGGSRPGYDRDPYCDPGNPYHQEQQYGQGYQEQSPPHGPHMGGDYGVGRPQIANPAHPAPVRDYGERSGPQNPRPDMPPGAGGFGDRPVPFRPGLAQANVRTQSPAPPVQAPPMQQAQPPQQAPVQSPQEGSAKPPAVTVAELNTLREGFKNNPNDHALGLRFAKRLVEAASVLSSEHGRADAKQTAKNRERYIFDATKVVKKLVSQNYTDAMFYLADCYGQGLLGLPVDPKEAFLLYQSAAKLNHPQSAYRVAVCCELGNEEGGGTRRDPLKAMQWYKRAATLGDTPAMYKMGMILLKGLLTQPKDPRQAVSWLKRAADRADKDNPHALHELGLLYESASSTDHILRDEKYALQLFTQAADLGYKYSQFRLGSAYEYGLIGCPLDARQSISWYSKAAAQGEHQSELALSGWYLTGAEPLLQQSDQEAYLWARKAAMAGLAKAEYAMGYFTETGIGMSSGVGSLEEAKRWYYRAAAQNMTKARERLEELKKGAKVKQKERVSRSHMKKDKDDCVVM